MPRKGSTGSTDCHGGARIGFSRPAMPPSVRPPPRGAPGSASLRPRQSEIRWSGAEHADHVHQRPPAHRRRCTLGGWRHDHGPHDRGCRRTNLYINGARVSSVTVGKNREHPEFGTVTLRQLLAIWVVHDLEHIAQAARVMANEYRDAIGSVRGDDALLRTRLRELAVTKPRWSSQQLHILLRREGHLVNHKKVLRLYREEGLAVSRRRRRKHVAIVRVPLPKPTERTERWSMDFVSPGA